MSDNPDYGEPESSKYKVRNTFRFSRGLYLPEHYVGSGTSDNNHEHAENTLKEWVFWSLEFFRKWITVLVGIGTIFILMRQTSIMDTQAEIMGKQADIAAKTLPPLIQQGQAATSAANTAADTLKFTQDSERPWVGIKAVHIVRAMNPNSPEQMKVNTPVINGGHMPALEFSADLELNIRTARDVISGKSSRPACNSPKRTWTKKTEGSLILPGPEPFNLFFSGAIPALKQDQIIEILRSGSLRLESSEVPVAPDKRFPNLPEKGLYVSGCLDYFDTLKQPHRTHFCQAFWPGDGGVFYACPRGNSAE